MVNNAMDSPFSIKPKYRLALPILLLCVFIVTCLAYYPGLKSEFFLDDKANLESLSGITTHKTSRSVLLFITQGNAGTFGRPISLASFAAQHASWPDKPENFKAVNLVIHLATGLVLFFLLSSLLRLASPDLGYRQYIALVITAIWLIHPIQITSVLYVVQRMTQLSALFVLTGMLFYVQGRIAFQDRKNTRGFTLISIGLILFGGLAVLSKENGVLILLFVLLLEKILFKDVPAPARFTQWFRVFIYAPLILGALFFIYKFDVLVLGGYSERPFGVLERLMTEFRVLAIYLANIFLVRPKAYGLFHDDIAISHSLLNPMTTLFSLLLLVGLVVAAIYYRKKAPLFSFGVLWFFAAHSLESTVFPLEVYFEHRNYVAIAGILIAVIPVFRFAWAKIKRPILKPVATGFVAIMILFATATTFMETRLWANPSLQAKIWSVEKPRSLRAQIFSIGTWIHERRYAKARQSLARTHRLYPGYTALLLVMVEFNCLDKTVSPLNTDEIIRKLSGVTSNHAFIHILHNLINMKSSKHCPLISNKKMAQILDIIVKNPALRPKLAETLILRGKFNMHAGRYLSALNDFERSLKMHPIVPTAMFQTRTCELLNNNQCALRAIKRARQISKRKLSSRLAFGKFLKDWQHRIEQRIAKNPGKSSHHSAR